MNKIRWKLTDEEYEFIKGEVVYIFIKYSMKCVPVSGFELASKMKFTLVPYSSLSSKKLIKAQEASEDGFYLMDKGREYIYLNDIDKNYERQNWTILHEIAHVVLDHTGLPEYKEQEEDEADFFAKYAIAPPVLIHKINACNIMAIYEAFDISLEAAIYAYNYYQAWLRRYKLVGHLTEYEEQLLALYVDCA